jgi:hypothetical protein
VRTIAMNAPITQVTTTSSRAGDVAPTGNAASSSVRTMAASICSPRATTAAPPQQRPHQATLLGDVFEHRQAG